MKLIISILLISTLIFGKELIFTQLDIEKIRKSPNPNAVLKRIDKYKELKLKIKDYESFRKISHINTFFNRILPQYDNQKYGISDYWSTRKEFLIDGRGDCEDYVIAKYFSLIENGFDKNRLFLAVVKVQGEQTDHMVLLYFENLKEIPLVLDNLSFKVMSLNKRTDLSVKFIFNEKASFLMEKNKISKRVNIDWGKDNKWDNLLTRVYKNNE